MACDLKVGVLRPFKAQWLLHTSPALAIHEFYLLPTQCVYMFFTDLRKKGGLFPYTKLTGFSLGAFAKLRKVTTKYVMSVRPNGTTLLPLDGFS